MRIFYARVSTEQQNEARQLATAKELNIDSEAIYIDKSTGANAKREQLNKMLEFVRKGDTIYIDSISRLARSTKDLLAIVDKLQAKQVELVSLKENIDTSTPQGKFMLTVFGALAELERESILERQKEGIAIAKAEGKYKGRQPMKIDMNKWSRLIAEWKEGKRTAKSIQKAFNITGTTFYRWVKENK